MRNDLPRITTADIYLILSSKIIDSIKTIKKINGEAREDEEKSICGLKLINNGWIP